MAEEIVYMPDVDGSGEVIEFCVEIGDRVSEGDSLIVIESDKASMEVPSPYSGIVIEWQVGIGAEAETGLPLAILSVENNPNMDSAEVSGSSAPPKASLSGEDLLDIVMPDAGGSGEVVELLASSGDSFREGDALLVVESDKASMEVPAPFSGTLMEILVKTGDSVADGDILATATSVSGSVEANKAERKIEEVKADAIDKSSVAQSVNTKPAISLDTNPSSIKPSQGHSVYSGPAARRLARELSVNLSEVKGTGPKGRILKEDIKAYVKGLLQSDKTRSEGSGIPVIPMPDFNRYGDTDITEMSGIAKATAAHMSRCWLNIPHVTLFDETDITELESFRASLSPEKMGVERKPTIMPFLIMVIAKALREHRLFNSSIDSENHQVIYKDYVNIGVAVDTPAGLVVPVIKDADKKGIHELSEELLSLARKARERKLTPEEMQGGCFTISSLGATGGTGFTPIINAPEVAILGVAKAAMKPHWTGSEFVPRKFLPLSLSFDHRVINGGDAGRFMASINQMVSEIRMILL